MPGKGPGAATGGEASPFLQKGSVLEARTPLTTPRLASRFLDERHSETLSSNWGAVVATEFQKLPDLQGLQSSLSRSPDLKSIPPPPSPHPSLPFSCPETHRSACPHSTRGAQTGMRETPPDPGSLLPWPFTGVGPGPGAFGSCTL